MTLNNAVFGSGAYAATFNVSGASGTPAGKTAAIPAQVLGLVTGVKTISRTIEGKDVIADLYGDSVIDGIYRGSNMFVSMIFKEWTTAVQNTLWPFGGEKATGVGDPGLMGNAGRMMTSLAGVLTLTAESGTPAATSIGATVTIHSAIISPGHTYDIPMGNDERDVPIVFRCYPAAIADADDVRWATFT